MLFLALKTGSNGQSQTLSDYHHQIKKSPPSKFFHAPHWGDFPIPLNVIWKTLMFKNQKKKLIKHQDQNILQTSMLIHYLFRKCKNLT